MTKIKLSYWIYPEGQDFDQLELFKNDLSKKYELEIHSEKTDALGGGLYEIALEIINNIDFVDFAKSYLEDGIKLGIGSALKPIFEKIKELFKSNKKYRPGFEIVKLTFKDVQVIIYPLYEESIDDAIGKILKTLSQEFLKIKNDIKGSVKSIHVPIFNQSDFHNLCDYRVKLNVDENIKEFSKKDYFKLWGIRTKKNDFVYNFKKEKIKKVKFYTQSEYDILFDNAENI